MRTPSSLRLLLLGSCLVATLANCGGEAKRPAQNATPQAEAISNEPSETTPAKTGPDCSDGGCMVCGDAQCPKGFFCDESSGKSSCQWVPTCTDSVDCGCVKKTVSEACDCDERDGGVHVRCKQ